ncbi:hypothetical protein EPUL_004032, partial [Erysiphe pulchra]
MMTSEVSARIRFLNESANLLFKSAPETSRYLMTKRNKLAWDNNVDIAETNLSKTCNACGTLMIIGWLGAISIEPGIPKRQKRQRKKVEIKKQQPRILIYECNTCHRKTRQNLGSRLITVKERKSLRISSLQTQCLPNKYESEPNTQNISMLASSTRKRRRTKKNTLETILEQKRKPQSSLFGLDLMDFLKKASSIISQSIEVDSNAALPNHLAWQNIFNDWDTIVANSNAFNFAIPLSVPSRIRQSLHQAHAAGKSSLSGSKSLDFAELYPSAAADLQIKIINKAVCFGQGLALMATFSSDGLKILFAGSYHNGNAYTWFEPHVSQETGEVDFQTFPNFLEALQAAFDDPDAYA